MITESDVDSLDEALPVDANIRVCTSTVESALETIDTDDDTNDVNGLIQTMTQGDSNTLSLVVSVDTTNATANSTHESHTDDSPCTCNRVVIKS